MAHTLKSQQAGRSAILRETTTQQESLEAAFHRPPKPCDSERRRTLFPCFQAGPIPAYWPAQPPSALVCDFRFYTNLADDSLFFIFYYQEGSLAQLLAAKVLKMRHWMFHTGHGYWFQRVDEPKVVTGEFERGQYKYWSWNAWSEQIKNDFTFEYRYLDGPLVPKWPYMKNQPDG